MSLSGRADVEIDDVVALLEQDSLIAGRILKVVGSAAFTGASKITSLRDATMRLGLNTIRDLVMEIAMNMRVFKSADYSDTMNLLRRHATATANICRVAGNHTKVEAELAFLAGLLHDVGIAGTLLALSDRKGKRKSPPDLISIWPAVDRVHQRAGELMAGLWELPEEIQIALSNHHQVIRKGEIHLLSATVAIANEVAHSLSAGVIPKENDDVSEMTETERDCVSAHTSVDKSSKATIKHAIDGLGLDPETLMTIRREAMEVLATLP
jgi:HD-like signal output (HDOD) protein